MELYLNNAWKRIGISISGGADSALLAYHVANNTSAEIILTNQIRCWKTRPWQEHVADTVIKWLMNNFDNITTIERSFIPPEMEEPHTTYIKDEYEKLKSGNRIILRAFNEYIAHKYKLDAWYNGVTKNPPVKFEGALSERDEGVLPLTMKHMGVDIIHPFVYTSKDKIIKEYYQEGIVELLNLTRSCEGEFEGLDYNTYTPGDVVPECGKCFWCKEREWAIEQNK